MMWQLARLQENDDSEEDQMEDGISSMRYGSFDVESEVPNSVNGQSMLVTNEESNSYNKR